MFTNEYFWTRLICTVYYVFACHWIGLLLRAPFMVSKTKLPILLFIYTIPFGCYFGANWKLLVIWLSALSVCQFAPKWASVSTIIIELLLYVAPIVAYYAV